MQTREEIVLSFYEDDRLIAIARKDKDAEFFTTNKMNYTKLVELFKTPKIV